MQSLAARIKEAMGDMSPADLARATKVTSAAVTFWLDGTTKSLRAEKAALIEAATGYRANWIVTGKGPKRVAEGGTGAAKGEVFQAPTAEEMKFLNNYRILKDKDKERLAAEIAAMAQERQEDIDDVLAKFGVQAAAQRANARRKRSDSIEVNPADPKIKQRPLPGLE